MTGEKTDSESAKDILAKEDPSATSSSQRAPDPGTATPEPKPKTETKDEKKDAGKKKSDSDRPPPLAPPGNPIQPVRCVIGAAIAVVGAALPFLIMASDRHWGFSVPVGLIGCALAAFGILEALGTFDDPPDRVFARANTARMAPWLLQLLAAGVTLIVSLRLAVSGVLGPQLASASERPVLPILAAAILVTGAFLWGTVALFRTGQALGAFQADEDGVKRGLLQRHGFWLIVLTTVLYLPVLGSYSLSDPWETHYGEVAREMLARDDWISLWWAQDGWFWSKPVLTFWIQGLCFALLGVRYAPDQMVSTITEGRFPQPEWAARMPTFILTVIGVYLLYKGVAKAFGRRPALLGSIVLITTPYWYFLAHQSMTDMLYVGPLTAAMGLFLLGLFTEPEERVRVYEIAIGSRKLRVSGYHVLFGLIIMCVLPQVLYLASRNLTLQIEAWPHGFRPHLDEFFAGSGGGNCGLPGNRGCRDELPVGRVFQPVHGALIWSAVAGILLWMNRGERRLGRLYFLAAWLFVVLSTMGKGAPGLVLGLLVPLVFIGATKRWKDLTRLELGGAVLLFACVLLPWFVQMYVRHGQQFTDRLVFHDMYKRAFVHVHDTNKGVDLSFRYYVWQLGYGLFPWTGLTAGGLLWWLRYREPDRKHDCAVFMVLWFVLTFSMCAISLTKFHHYIFPAVPPAAMLTGLLLERALGTVEWPEPRRLVAYLAGAAGGTALLVYGVYQLFPGGLAGTVLADEQLPEGSVGVGVTFILIGILLAVGSVFLFGRKTSSEQGAPDHGQEAPPAAPPPSGEGGGGLEAVGGQASSEQGAAGHGRKAPGAAPPPSGEGGGGLPSGEDGGGLGAVGVAAAVVVALAGRDMFVTNKGDVAGNARLMHLFTYNYSRHWPKSLNFDAILIAFTIVAAILCALLLLQRWRTHITAMLCCTAVLWAAWGVNVYLVQVSPHWGQRETIMAYYLDRSSPEEPIVAYQMNWKGENFYTGNRTPAFVSSGEKFKKWVKQQETRGVKAMYFTTEHSRVKTLKRELNSPKDFEVITTPELNNKFMIARMRF